MLRDPQKWEMTKLGGCQEKKLSFDLVVDDEEDVMAKEKKLSLFEKSGNWFETF